MRVPQRPRRRVGLRTIALVVLLASIGLAFVRPHVVRRDDYSSDFLFPWQAARHPAPLSMDSEEFKRFQFHCVCPLAIGVPCPCPELLPYTAMSYPTAWFFVAYDIMALTMIGAYVRRGVQRVRTARNICARIAFDLALVLGTAIIGVVIFGIGMFLVSATFMDVSG